MTLPRDPLAHVLETVREVRLALAYVPQLCADRKYQEAYDVIDEQATQLQELWRLADTLAIDALGPAQPQIDTTLLAANHLLGRARTVILESATRPHDGPGAAPPPNPGYGFADQPLW